MGSTPAQSLQGSPWPASRPFTLNLSTPWFLALPSHVISFWKAIDKANKIVKADFLFSLVGEAGACGEIVVGRVHFVPYAFFTIKKYTSISFKI